MDIALLSMAMSQDKVMTDFGTAMLSKALDTQENVGSEVVQMIDAAAMERSVNPAVGANFDISI